MKTNLGARAAGLACVLLALGVLGAACGSNHGRVATAEEVRDDVAIQPARAVPGEPALTDSEAAPAAPGGAAEATPPPEPPLAKEALREAQLARVSHVVNTAAVEQGKLAQGRAKAPGVKRFANMMVKHHGDALRLQALLVKKLGITSEDSATAASLLANAEKTLETLKTTDAAGFDAAYIASQIEAHQKVLDLLDTQVVAVAKTPEVENALQRARELLDQHLREARALQAK